MTDLRGLQAAIEAGDQATAVSLTRAAIEEGLAPDLILGAMTDAMGIIGARFQRNEIYVPEMLVAARAMKEAITLLKPVLADAGVRPSATAVIGTVKGDLHDIGKNLVGMMWKGANIEVIDLGTNVPADRFVQAAKEHNARIVGISALLTTTMGGMRDVIAAVGAARLDGVKTIVGGAPVTAEFAREIGADGYAPNAGAAVDAAKALLRGEPALGPIGTLQDPA